MPGVLRGRADGRSVADVLSGLPGVRRAGDPGQAVSGFVGQAYDLTATKALYWHRTRGACGCQTLSQIVGAHLGAFRVVVWGRHHVRLTGPGLRDGSTDVLFQAVSGRVSL